MNEGLIKYPGKKVNLIMLIAGAVIFIPIYSYNVQLVMKVMSVETLTKLMLSFDYTFFKEIIGGINNQGNMDQLFFIYLLNIISTTGYMLLFFSLTVIIARAVKQDGKIRKIAYFIPLLIPVIGLLDIIAAFIFMYIAKNFNQIASWMVYTIDINYVIRMILLWVSILWILFASGYLLYCKLKKR